MLQGEGKQAQQQAAEIDRIMTTFNLNPYEILGVRFDASKRNISLTYRRIAAVIHPEKCKHVHARAAFEKVKDAYEALQDKDTVDKYQEVLKKIKDEILAHKLRDLKNELGVKGTQGSLVGQLLEKTEGNAEEQDLDGKARVNAALKEYEASNEFYEDWKRVARQSLIRFEWRMKRTEDRREYVRDRKNLVREKKIAEREARELAEKNWLEGRDRRLKEWREYLKETEKREFVHQKRDTALEGILEETISDDYPLIEPKRKDADASDYEDWRREERYEDFQPTGYLQTDLFEQDDKQLRAMIAYQEKQREEEREREEAARREKEGDDGMEDVDERKEEEENPEWAAANEAAARAAIREWDPTGQYSTMPLTTGAGAPAMAGASAATATIG
eukprot:CAMPEP_0167795300 /NCGR_PEP_ID=MMETSP0111_2-20121227/14358_1 /TAXON_ID=91324 /ORGANISM="Lotharella globosa, Strain CCCM811" /LENGTH=389 /DNA_ID=CAMNT_0007688951 /DNA_START=183 /DNA_END=1352 /DNA_ORIENTATION=+